MDTEGEPPSGARWRNNWETGGILRALVIWSGVGIGVGIVVEIVFARLASGAWLWMGTSALTSAQWYDVTRSSIATVGLFGLGGAALLAYRRQGTAEKNEKISAGQHELEKAKNATAEISDLRARFAMAAEQLGHARPAVRLAGVYSMAALADDWHTANELEQQKVCVNVLCAYLRMPYDPRSAAATSGEKEVRLTIIKTISERLQKAEALNSWCGFSLDFTGVVFDGGDFSGAQFTGGKVFFSGAQFTGGTVVFYGAQFKDGTVLFDKAQFTGGNVFFYEAQFTGGNVFFSGAQFTGGKVFFSGAQFTGGTVNFDNAQFIDGTVNFNGASGSDKRVLSFVAPIAWNHPPQVPWSDGESPPWVSPEIWPPVPASEIQNQDGL